MSTRCSVSRWTVDDELKKSELKCRGGLEEQETVRVSVRKGLQVLVPEISGGRVLVLIARSPKFDVYQPPAVQAAVAGISVLYPTKFWMKLDSDSEFGQWSESGFRPDPAESGPLIEPPRDEFVNWAWRPVQVGVRPAGRRARSPR